MSRSLFWNGNPPFCPGKGFLIERECRYGDYTLSRKDDQRWQKRKHRSRSTGPLH